MRQRSLVEVEIESSGEERTEQEPFDETSSPFFGGVVEPM